MGTVSQSLDIAVARFYATVQPPQRVQDSGTNFPLLSLAFDGAGATVEGCFWEVFVAAYGASNPNVVIKVEWMPAANPGASQNVIFQAALAAITPGDNQSRLTDAFATAVAASAVSVSTTDANKPKESVITISGASLDSLAAGDSLTVKLFRDPANAGDTYTNDAKVTMVQLEYSDT
jgi:hypothetical protein